jgi:multidrug efflux system membrane fusion protein
MALAKLADVQAQRFGELARAGAVSELDAETRATDKSSTMAVVEADRAIIETASAQILADRANLKNADAQLASAKAALENARVQLNFTTVNAPITGRTGKILVLKGNNIRADEDILVTINQIAPIYVEFAVPDEQFGLVQRYGMNALKARAILNGHEYREGRITFTDNTVDNTTGTVKLKAIFDNTDSALWPGKYVDVILTLDTLHGAVVVPDHSISTGQSGQFVWVVKNDVARMQQVKTGPSVDGYTAIESGVSAGDVIVTDGQLQLSEGAKVQIAGQPQ